MYTVQVQEHDRRLREIGRNFHCSTFGISRGASSEAAVGEDGFRMHPTAFAVPESPSTAPIGLANFRAVGHFTHAFRTYCSGLSTDVTAGSRVEFNSLGSPLLPM